MRVRRSSFFELGVCLSEHANCLIFIRFCAGNQRSINARGAVIIGAQRKRGAVTKFIPTAKGK